MSHPGLSLEVNALGPCKVQRNGFSKNVIGFVYSQWMGKGGKKGPEGGKGGLF